MQISIPTRKTIHVNSKESIARSVARKFRGLPEDENGRTFQDAYSGIDALGDMRLDIERLCTSEQSPELETLENSHERLSEYLSALVALANKYELKDLRFPWSNSLGCSHTMVQGEGLWFEILNVVFNIGSLLSLKATLQPTSDETVRSLQQAAGAFQHAGSITTLKLAGHVPPELSSDTLKLLADLCLIQASDLSANNCADKWTVSTQYKTLAERVVQQNIKNNAWVLAMNVRAAELVCAACLEVAMSLRPSRKHEDKVMQKAVLIKCLELAKKSGNPELICEHAEKLLNEPISRRNKSPVRDIAEDFTFNPSTYFESRSTPLCESIHFMIPKSQYFSNLLAEKVIFTPYILKERLVQKINESIRWKLCEMNHRMRSELALHNIPAAAELVFKPGAPPQSMMSVLNRIYHRRCELNQLISQGVPRCSAIHPLHYLCRALLAECRQFATQDEISVGKTNLKLKLEEAQSVFESLDDYISRHQEMLDLVANHHCDNGILPTAISDFLGYTLPNTSSSQAKHRSTPTFWQKTHTFYESTLTEMYERDCRSNSVLDRATSYDFHEVVVKLDEVHNEGTMDMLLNNALSHFSEDILYVERSQKSIEQSIHTIKELKSQFKPYAQLLDSDRAKLVKSLMLTAAKWFDIDSDLTQIYETLKTLKQLFLFSQERQKPPESKKQSSNQQVETCISESPLKNAHFNWQPGTAVNICIK